VGSVAGQAAQRICDSTHNVPVALQAVAFPAPTRCGGPNTGHQYDGRAHTPESGAGSPGPGGRSSGSRPGGHAGKPPTTPREHSDPSPGAAPTQPLHGSPLGASAFVPWAGLS